MNLLLHHKRLTIALLVVGLGLLALLGFVISSALSRPDAPPPEQTLLPSPSPTVAPSFSPLPADHHKVAQQDPQDTNPVIVKLPKLTRYWSLKVAGRENGKYLLDGTVFYRKGQDPAAQVSQQREFIEQFIHSTGQPVGSYVLSLKAQEVFVD